MIGLIFLIAVALALLGYIVNCNIDKIKELEDRIDELER